jgi:hypothetical protein
VRARVLETERQRRGGVEGVGEGEGEGERGGGGGGGERVETSSM